MSSFEKLIALKAAYKRGEFLKVAQGLEEPSEAKPYSQGLRLLFKAKGKGFTYTHWYFFPDGSQPKFGQVGTKETTSRMTDRQNEWEFFSDRKWEAIPADEALEWIYNWYSTEEKFNRIPKHVQEALDKYTEPVKKSASFEDQLFELTSGDLSKLKELPEEESSKEQDVMDLVYEQGIFDSEKFEEQTPKVQETIKELLKYYKGKVVPASDAVIRMYFKEEFGEVAPRMLEE